MGLVSQARAFIHLGGSDRLENSDEGFSWHVTGRNRCFLHHCEEAKWSSYDAAKHALRNLDTLRHSLGFFSLTGDYLDRSDRDRAYFLGHGQFREVNTRHVLSSAVTPPGLYQHFEWCRTCFWPMDDTTLFPSPPTDWQQIPGVNEPATVAGWFFIDDEHKSFPSLVELFPPETAAVARSSCWADHYLFVGEDDICLKDVLIPLLEASRRFPQGSGLLHLPGKPRIPQIAIAAGQCCTLAPLEPDDWGYHESPAFYMEPFGYKKR